MTGRALRQPRPVEGRAGCLCRVPGDRACEGALRGDHLGPAHERAAAVLPVGDGGGLRAGGAVHLPDSAGVVRRDRAGGAGEPGGADDGWPSKWPTGPAVCSRPGLPTLCQDGIMPAGPGARDLSKFFAHVDGKLVPDAAQAAGAPRVRAGDRDVLNLLTERAKTLHPGAANYCWFTDPSRALCLKPVGTPNADRPLVGMCDSARCRRPPTTPATGPSGPGTPTRPKSSPAVPARPERPRRAACGASTNAPGGSCPGSTPPAAPPSDHAADSAALLLEQCSVPVDRLPEGIPFRRDRPATPLSGLAKPG